MNKNKVNFLEVGMGWDDIGDENPFCEVCGPYGYYDDGDKSIQFCKSCGAEVDISDLKNPKLVKK